MYTKLAGKTDNKKPQGLVLDQSSTPALSIIGLHLLIAIPLATLLNIWIDECYSLNTSNQGVSYAFWQAINNEQQGPLYFTLLSFWRYINHSIFFARLFSIVCTVATILVCKQIGESQLKGNGKYWFMAAVALNPFTIWAAIEIRLYALAMLLSALLVLCFVKGYLETQRNNYRIYYMVLGITALYTQSYMGALLIANGCALIVLRKWNALRAYVLGMIPVSLLFTPLFLVSLSHLSSRTHPSDENITSLDALLHLAGRVMQYILPTRDATSIRRLVFLAILGTLIVLLSKSRRFKDSRLIAFIIIDTCLLLIFALLTQIVGYDYVGTRHTVVAFIPIILLLFIAFELALRSISRKNHLKLKISLVCLLIFLFSYLSTLYSMYKPMAKLGDWERVAHYIQTTEKPNQPIVMFSPEIAMPLQYYYSGINQFIPLPKPIALDKPYNVSNFRINHENEIMTALAASGSDPEALWLVTNYPPDSSCKYAGIALNCKLLEEFVHEQYEVKQDRDFHYSRVRFLSRKAA